MSIAELLVRAAAGHTGRPALTHAGRSLGYDELAGICGAGAAELAASGARTVVFIGVGSSAFPIAMFAAAYAGLPFVPLNYRLAPAALAELVGRVERPVVLADRAYVDDPAFAEAVGPAGLALWDATSHVDSWAAAPVTDPVPAEVDPAEPAVILFTSGTTATPKGVLLSHANLGYIGQYIGFGSAPVGATGLVSTPPYHVIGVTTVFGAIQAGRRLIYLGDFDPAAWLEVARAESVTSATLVPTMLARLTAYLHGRTGDVPTLRLLAYGGAKLPRPVLERALKSFPEVDFINAYGLTETSATVTILFPDDHRAALTAEDPVVAARLGSAGRAVPGVELQVRGPGGDVLPAGVTGELWVRGAQVSRAYLGTGSALDGDGWFPTRDHASLDRDGYLFVEGRSDDVIIRGGENIAPAEIEDVLVEHPDVEAVVVIGVPDEEWGERITAVVVPAPGRQPDPAALREYVRARLRGSRTPDDVVFRSELPQTDTGKVQRRVLVRELS